MLTISDFNNVHNPIPIYDRKCIIITARMHPGESNGSYMMKGFLDFILSQCEEAKFLLQRNIFKIIPMINPDGVIAGNYRTGFGG